MLPLGWRSRPGIPALHALLRGVRDPYKFWAFAAEGDNGVARVNRERSIASLLGCTPRKVRRLVGELENEGFSKQIIQARGEEYRGEVAHGDVLYAVCRILEPTVVVETGVASGFSSAHILKALRVNDRGRLHSIDLPNYEEVLVREIPGYLPRPVAIVPPGKGVGWVIPEALQDRWQLSLGKTGDVLPTLLREIAPIDLFLHDSEHTYSNMTSEFAMGWNALRPGGLLISDDVLWNPAFQEFCHRVAVSGTILDERFGLLMKPRRAHSHAHPPEGSSPP